ncbi:hypothetical protein Kisp01_66080 [Kineosporia sp. NBRC 101677]|nr:hypothetical protein Kisp01_66080 [Kineosporia sp. NBRC 101677]
MQGRPSRGDHGRGAVEVWPSVLECHGALPGSFMEDLAILDQAEAAWFERVADTEHSAGPANY